MKILVNTTNSGSARTITSHYSDMNMDYVLKKSSFVRTAVMIFNCNPMEKLDKSKMKNVRIRKLTNRECYRFMGVPEDYIDKLLATDIARGQHYKMAGNSICVPVLTAVFKRMFIDKTKHKPQQLSLFSLL